ncbi:DUF748 domain-containing protein [Roseateles koreensis]|uniref:DUF748 domain-containing protein n=1 Tax=Roseateles koreensis TaxID=2987526 RepID=A0ABT5KVI1_9BURK|nr:DUF748 domain-containing protein [Roseateles koreensis]MDC8786934.1 DUF748 domain-containing protein [Roseateles koreensis]
MKSWQRWLIGLFTVLVILLLLSVFALPRLIQGMGARAAGEALGREVKIGAVSVQPWRLGLVVDDVQIAGLPGQSQPLFTLGKLDLALSARSLWYFSPVVQEISVTHPVLHVSRTGPGAYDVDDLITKFSGPSTAKPSSEPLALAIYNISVTDGELVLDDQPVGCVHVLKQLHVGLPFVSTRHADIAVKVQPAVSGVLNGVSFGSEGAALPFSEQREAQLSFKLNALDLTPYIAYLPKSLPLQLVSGWVDADLSLNFRQPPKQAPKVDIRGQLGLREFVLQKPTGEPWLKWQKLDIALDDVQPVQRKIALGEVNWQGLQLALNRDANGVVWLPVPPAAGGSGVSKAGRGASAVAKPAPSAAAGASMPWGFSVTKFTLSDSGMSWADAAVPGASRLQVKDLRIALSGMQWPLEKPAALKFSMQIQPLVVEAAGARGRGKAGGADASAIAESAAIKGEGSVSPDDLKLGMQWSQLALQWFEPYWSAQLPVKLRALAAGQVSVAVPQPLAAEPLSRLTVQMSDFELSTLALSDPHASPADTILRLAALRLDHLDLNYADRLVNLGTLSVDAPQVSLARAKNSAWNWQALVPSPNAADRRRVGRAENSMVAEASTPSAVDRRAHKTPASSRSVLRLSGPDESLAPGSNAAQVATSVQPVKPASGKSAEWQVALQALQVDRGLVRFQDAAAPAGVASLVADQLKLRLGPLAWPKTVGASRAQLSFSLGGASLARQAPVNGGRASSNASVKATPKLAQASARPAGDFRWDGRLSLAPLAASGKLRAERLPIQLLDAYMDPGLNLQLQRADLGWRGDFNVRQVAKDWRASVSGDLLLADLSAHQGRVAAGSGESSPDLLSWQALNLDGVQFEMKPGAPPELAIKVLRLNDFFASLLINENGRFNLRDVKASAPASSGGQPAAASSPALASANGPATASVATSAASAQGLPVQISLGQAVVRKGRVDFADHFVRPNYSAQLTELEGSLGAVRSGNPEMAPLQLRGRVAGTGLLEIDGALNPLGAPLTLDIKASATDIELAPMSPYSEKYAGYAIERGKFSSKVAYKIEANGALQANNQLILNQLTFGDAVNSPDATKLPVRLAVSLLKDSDGVIDVELPISGSLNDPQFSVGGVIGKLILNLIGKALTSPFSLLAGKGGVDHSQIEFLPGSAIPKSPEVLDKIARMLIDRPTLNLTIVGEVDLARERLAMQEAQLDAAMLAQRRLELQRRQTAGADAQAAGFLVLSDADRARLLKLVYEATKLPNKPRNVLGFAKDISGDEMRALLLPSYPANAETARTLSVARGVAVRDALIAKGLPNQRIFVAAPKLHTSDDGDALWKPMAELKLAID